MIFSGNKNFNSKGDISLTTIIVAAIGLIVLIVLIAIFTGRINVFGKSYDDTTQSAESKVCNAIGGSCSNVDCATAQGYADSTKRTAGQFIDCGASQWCCKA